MSVLTEEQLRAVDNYMSTKEVELDIETARCSKRELYDRLQNDPKFDACYKQAVSEKLVERGILEKASDSGYPNNDPDLELARKYVRDQQTPELTLEPAPEQPVQKKQSRVYIKHVSKLVINFNA